MRVLKFIIENYKSLRGRHEFKPGGCNFILVGQNGSGKTSAGHALIDIVTKNIPSKPISDGENEGYIEYQFDNGQRLLAKFNTDGKSKIELITSDGLKIDTPKELWKKLSGEAMNFDIDSFITMAPKPRRELLEKMVGVDLTSLNEKEDELFDQRKIANAAAKVARAKCKPFNLKLVEIDEDPKEIFTKYKEMTEHNEAVIKVQKGCEDRKVKISNLKLQLEALTKEISIITEQLEKGESWLKENMLHPDEEIAKINDLMENATAISEAKNLKAVKDEAERLEAEAKELDNQIEDLRQKKETIIKQAHLPAEGLRFDPESDKITLDGLPFEDNQISASRKLICAIQLATAMLGEIRYLHFDGAALDKNNCDRILEWAEENNLQLCIERPLFEGGEGVKMEIFDNSAKPTLKEIIDDTKPKKSSKNNNINSQPKVLPWD